MPSIIDRLQYTLKQFPVARRLYRRLKLKRDSERSLVSAQEIEVGGLRFRIDHDVQMRLNYQDPTYFADFRSLVSEYVNPGDVAIDIGAHVGITAAMLRNGVGDAGRVYAFEPTPSLYALLEDNVRANELGNVHPLQIALSSSTGTTNFFVSHTHSGYNSMSSSNAMAFTNDPADVESISVETSTLDDFLADRAVEPSFIKIDTQGAEFEILKGARKFLTSRWSSPVYIYLEFNPDGVMSLSDATGNEMLSFMEELGLKIKSAFPFDSFVVGGRIPTAHRAEFLDNITRRGAGYINLMLRAD
jgi:FkbM family methyltransferase